VLIHQDSVDDPSGTGVRLAFGETCGSTGVAASTLSPSEREVLWDRIVRIHYLAADLAQPGLAPHVTEEMTRFVTAVLREWAVQAEEGLRKTQGQA